MSRIGFASSRIERLSAEQIARFPEFVERWTRIGLCTDPANRQEAQRAITLMYRMGRLTPPEKIVWCGSPLSLGLARAIILGRRARDSVRDSLWDSFKASVWDSLEASAKDSVMASARASVHASVEDPIWDFYDEASVRGPIWYSLDPSARDSVRASVRASLEASVRDSLWDSVQASVRASVGASVTASVRDSVLGSVKHSVEASVGPSVWASVEASVRDSVGAPIPDSVGPPIWDSIWDSVSDSKASLWASVGASVAAPVGASVAASVSDSVKASVLGCIEASVLGSVGVSVTDFVQASVGNSVRDWVRDSVLASSSGQHDIAWLAFYDYFREVCNLTQQTDRLSGLWSLAHCAGGLLPFQGICWVCERPQILCRDNRGRLHCLTGPACAFPDGSAIYAVHGVRVPAFVIENLANLSTAIIDKERNAEVRRVMVERYGEARYLKDSGATIVHSDAFGVLYRKEITGDEPLVMVKVKNSAPEPDGSFKEYFLRVPPDIHTAQAAVAWTFALENKEYSPVVET